MTSNLRDLEIENSFLKYELLELHKKIKNLAEEKHKALEIALSYETDLTNLRMDNMILQQQILIATTALRKKDWREIEHALLMIQAYDKPRTRQGMA